MLRRLSLAWRIHKIIPGLYYTNYSSHTQYLHTTAFIPSSLSSDVTAKNMANDIKIFIWKLNSQCMCRTLFQVD